MFKYPLTKIIIKHRLLREARASYIRGFWPEPVTQQTLAQFLEEINYFEEPRRFINIGLDETKYEKKKDAKPEPKVVEVSLKDIEPKQDKIDELLELLSIEAETPTLDYDDIKLEGEQLLPLAKDAGIFRDLFGRYKPKQDDVYFTQKQAENMNTFVPRYWLTDQPFATVDRHPKEVEPLQYFTPLVGVSARFIHEPKVEGQQASDDIYAHVSYHGNIIPACEALEKPSITLDGKLISSPFIGEPLKEKSFGNWVPGTVRAVNFNEDHNKYYTVALVNLDYLHEDSVNLHWMVSNIRPSKNNQTIDCDEVCDYLPVHGIRGFGYSRYTFLVFQHDSKLDPASTKIDGFSLEARKFSPSNFLNQHKASNLVPVGLSWFQTLWDESSNKIFHDIIQSKAPVYEHVQTKLEKRPEQSYPGKVPFNIYLDYQRDPKDINEQVLLERLKTVEPTNYKDQYVPPKVPPTVFEDENIPSWMKNVMLKKKNRIGYWRGLRPSSITLPLNNNADLDYPIRPVASSSKARPDAPNLYPAKIRYKQHKDMPTSKPINEHQSVFIQDDHQNHLDEVKKIMKEMERKK